MTVSGNIMSMSRSKERFAKKSLHNELEIIRLVWRSARGQHLKMTIALVLEIMIGLFPPAAIYIVQRAAGVNAGNIEGLLTSENVLYALGIFFIYILMTKVTRVMMAYSVAEVEFGLRMRFSESLRDMPYEDVMTRIGMQSSNGLTQEIAMVGSLVPMIYKQFIRGGVTIVAFCVLLIVISPKFFLIVITLLLTVLVSIVLLRRSLKGIYKTLYDKVSSLYRYFSEWISGYRVFRVYGVMDYAVTRMQDVFLTIRRMSRRLTVVANSQSAFAEMLTYTVAAIIIVMMPNENGVIQFSVLISYPAAILYIRGDILNLINGYQQLSTTESSVSRLLNVINFKNEGDRREECVEGDIRCVSFSGVGYAYRNEKKEKVILEDADLDLCRGSLYVLSGASGRGKTTTLNLMMGLLKPQKGEIIYDISEENGRKIGLVEQEPYFFDGSIFENICMGRSGITEDSVMKLIDEMSLTRVFPDIRSLHTDIEKLDNRLSSGEKQRLALIRALVGNPSMLIVDEVTSNIDIDTSRIIIDKLKRMAKDILIVAVSHDPLLVEAADVEYRLENKRYSIEEKNKKVCQI